MTLRELKQMVAEADRKEKVPTPKTLFRADGEPIVSKDLGDDGIVAVFTSGYVLYAKDRRATVFTLHECEAYSYKSLMEADDELSADIFEDAEWYLRLFMEGEDRMRKNQSKCDSYMGLISYSKYGDSFLIADTSIDFDRDLIQEEMCRELEMLLALATEKQQRALRAYYEMEENATAAAKLLGIARQSCDELVDHGIKRIRREYRKKYGKDLKWNF